MSQPAVDIIPPYGCADLTISRGLCTGEYTLSGWGQTVRLREWTWAERRRLIQSCVTPGGLDRGRFVQALVSTLYSPPPPDALFPLYAYTALMLMGIVPGGKAKPNTRAEMMLSRTFGWHSEEIDRQSAVSLDRYLSSFDNDETSHRISSGASDAAGGEWSRIVVEDGE